MKPVPETIIDSYTFEHWFFFLKNPIKTVFSYLAEP